MMLARPLALLVASTIAVSSADAASFCGIAINFGNGAQAKVRLKAYKPSGEGVDARLVCTKWRTICNGKSGKIHADVRTDPSTGSQALYGTLRYGTKLTCGVFCQVDGSIEVPNMLFCQFNCPTTADAVQVSFTVGPAVCS
jgi:hypothetical protein